LVLMGGPDMKALAEALPDTIPSEYRASADDLRPVVFEKIHPGDVVMVKSSKGIGFARLVDALIKQFPADAGRATPG
jgi:UDP-N-acetylmuramoyl-tripeptide--D-alanyl-D-alanine ligase